MNDSLNNSGTETIYGTQNVSGGSSALTNTGLIQEGNGALIAVTGDALNSGTITTTQAGQGAGNEFTVSGVFTNERRHQQRNGSQDLVSMAELKNAGQVNVTLGEIYVGPGTAPALAGGLAEYDEASGGVLDEVFSGNSTFGTIDVSGSVFLNGGLLEVELPSGFAPSIGTTYDILTFTPGDLNGVFNFTSPTFDSGTEIFTIDYDNTDGYVGLTVASSGECPTHRAGTGIFVPDRDRLDRSAYGVVSHARHR